jgi:hypothetical protein
VKNLVFASLEAAYGQRLTAELTEAHSEAKRNFYLRGHRLNAVAGGRFCEAAYRILQLRTTKEYTPLGAIIDTAKIEARLSSIPAAQQPKSVRIYIPRALRVVYDIRNSRNAAHLADGIDPSIQDATLVVAVLDWVMAELVRLSGKLKPSEAQSLIERMVSRSVPVIQQFGEFPKVLRTDLRASEYILVLLIQASPGGVRLSDLRDWVPESMASNMRRTLASLETKALVHLEGDQAFITYAGERYVDTRNLLSLGEDDPM